MDKRVAKRVRPFRTALAYAGLPDADEHVASFERRLEQMYASPLYAEHNVYPSIDAEHVYGVVAMCVELRGLGLSDGQIFDAVNAGFTARRRFFDALIRAIDCLPNAFSIARKWNISDHDKRIADGSIDYDLFEVGEHSLEYRISGCRYVEMFEAWGVRPLCKIFCETDTRSYAGLTRHIEFVRHSDLSDGPTCHDEIFERGYRNSQ